MTITGKLVKKLPLVSGESSRGTWVRGGFVIEIVDEYHTKLAFTVFGEERNATLSTLQDGSMVEVTFIPESREYNDKWYTDLRCTKIEVMEQVQAPPTANYQYAAPAPQPSQQAQPAPALFPANPAPAATIIMPEDNDLPFDR